MSRLVCVVTLSVFAFACAHRSTNSEFPSAATLDALAQQAPPVTSEKDDVVFVDRWELKGPFPQVLDHVPHTAATPWEELLAARVKQKQGTLQATEDMNCVARELGLFYLANKGRPSNALSDFIEGRCATAAENVQTLWLSGDVEASVADEKLFEHWKADFEKMLDNSLVGGNRIAGVWFGRHDGRAVAMIATGVRTTTVQPLSLFPESDGTLRISGELLIAAKGVRGSVNQGKFGFADCKQDESVSLPRFVMSCPIDPSDTSTWVELHVFQSGRLLGNLLFKALAWPTKSPSNVYVQPTRDGLQAPSGSPGESFTALVNQVRKAAGQPALELSAPQSELATKLAPHYFAALFGKHDAVVADQVALGVLAGWYVGKPLRDGNFDASFAPKPGDLTAMVVDMLEHPQGRRALLNPDVSAVAFGPLLDGEQKLRGAIVGTYALMDAKQRAQLESRALERLNKVRASKGLPPAKLRPFAGNDAAVEALAKGVSARAVMDRLLDQTVNAIQRPVQGVWNETHDVDDFEVGEALLKNEAIEVSLAVGTAQNPDQPWMHYVLMWVVSAQGSGPMASRETMGTGYFSAPISLIALEK